MRNVKKIVSILVLNMFFLSSICTDDTTLSDITNTKVNIDPDETRILWDLHGVIFKRKISTAISIFYNYNRKFEIIRSLNIAQLKIMGNFLLHSLHLTPEEVTSEELIEIAKKADNTALIELALRIGSAYHPIEETTEIVKKLAAKNYQQDVGSNIGTTLYELFQNKYPLIFSHFSNIHIAHYRTKRDRTKREIVKKPGKKYFATYLKDHNIKAHRVIFIDDKYTNTQAAKSVGIHAIHFKNPSQLRNALQEIGISLTAPGHIEQIM